MDNGARVLNRLIEQAHNSDPIIRENSVYLIGEMALEAKALMKNTLKSSDQLEKMNVLTNPKNMTVVVAELIRCLQDASSWVRGNAADALGKIGDPIASMPLALLISDEDKVVRYSVVEALGKICTEESVECLIKALEDKEWSVRLIAAKSLEKLPDKRAEYALRITAKDSNQDVRQRSIAALAKLTT